MNAASRLKQLITDNRSLIAVTALALVITLFPAPPGQAAPADRHFRVRASSFQYTPAILTVNPGDRVTLELASADVVHGLYLDGYGLRLTADPGQPATVTFTADRLGTFRFRCSVTCGPLHPFMIGKLRVGPNWLLWRAMGLAALLAFGNWSLVANLQPPTANRQPPAASR